MGIVLAVCAFSLSAAAQRQPDAAPALEPDLVEAIASDDSEAAASDETETITETIGDQDADEVGVASLPEAAPESEATGASRAKLSGWARESFEFYPYDGGLHRGDMSDVLGVPRDRLVSRTQLLARASYQRGRWFEVAVSGVLGLTVHVEGSGGDLGVRGWGGSQGTVELHDATLRELYLGFFARNFDLRIGQQRVAWGVADVLSPNDVVNARDLRDPFLAEPELNRMPTPMLRGSGYFGPVTLELLVAPVFIPDRGSLYGTNWSAIQPDAPASYRGLFSTLARAVDPSIQEQLNNAVYQTRLPNRNGGGVSAGAKLGVHTQALDLNFYYHYGYDGMPYFWLNPTLAGLLESTDFSRAGFGDLAPVARAVDQGLTPLFAEYVRRHHVGFDMVAPLGPFVLRLDAAYESQRVFYRADLTSIASPAVLSVLSFDYQTGSVDKVLVVEWVYVRVIDEFRGPLLVYERDSYGFAAVARWPLFSILGLEARTMLGIAPYFYVAQPALVLKPGNFTIKAGAIVMDGEPNSLGWYYRHNLTAFLQVRYGF